MLMRELPLQTATPAERRNRELVALMLRTASRALDAMAARLAWAEPRAAGAVDPVLEYHADAGAPEGALYVDGQLVGRVLGVNRL